MFNISLGVCVCFQNVQGDVIICLREELCVFWHIFLKTHFTCLCTISLLKNQFLNPSWLSWITLLKLNTI